MSQCSSFRGFRMTSGQCSFTARLVLVREAEAFAQTAVLVRYNAKGANRRILASTSTEYFVLRAKLHTCTPDQPLASAIMYQHTSFC